MTTPQIQLIKNALLKLYKARQYEHFLVYEYDYRMEIIESPDYNHEEYCKQLKDEIILAEAELVTARAGIDAKTFQAIEKELELELKADAQLRLANVKKGNLLGAVLDFIESSMPDDDDTFGGEI